MTDPVASFGQRNRRWQTRTPYDEVTYLNALQRRGSPLFKHIAAVPETA